ncbi:Transient receptor potential cation channel subfamily M member 6 [Stylophora pistillata]|uniref:Transient receptor potential cation channel subfamily M member 6 n=1 Tax=Stylophora pistillata TaxID=50429 RepID=A0A2B4SZX5_STYPI|nr:Transient receptor potential cation channel subfamily M member 6 [Stylophora pistillata]
MKQRKEGKEKWEDFEARVGMKRSCADTRDFVPFGDYDDLTMENIKEACEKYYQAPEGSYDKLAPDRGPSCTKLEQIKGKKVYFIRFLPPKSTDVAPKLGQQLFEDSLAPAKVTMSVPSPVKTSGNLPALHSMVFPKSVSVTELLKAAKLVKPPATNITVLDLESFDVAEMKWVKSGSLTLEIEERRLANGAFRDAFRSTTIGKDAAQTAWVVKQYQEEAAKTINDDLSMSLGDHTRKQVQMSAVVRHLTKRFAKSVPPEFGGTFEYVKVFFALFKKQPVTIEEFVQGEFHKYVNNNGFHIPSPSVEFDEIYEKAQCLVNYSYQISEKKVMLLDIQGSSFKLYDPDIATTDLLVNDSKEVNFYAGNLSCIAIDEFKSKHTCNKYCGMVSLKVFDENGSDV